MELRSFISGALVTFALFVLLPVLNVKVSVSNPFGIWGSIAAAIVAFVLAYYVLKMG